MKRLTILFVLVCVPAIASAAITNTVYRVYKADSNTPYNGKPIMVGTKLAIVGSSTSSVNWDCDLLIPQDYYDDNGNPLYGVLTGRDYNDNTLDYAGSRFPAAGDSSVVWDDIEPGFGFGLVFYCGYTAVPGNWFIIDYTALNVGDCNVAIYEKKSTDMDFPDLPNQILAFHHVPTRDFNNDTRVNFKDYTTLASYWQKNCSDPNHNCYGADLDNNGVVNINDLMLFCEYWLENTTD